MKILIDSGLPAAVLVLVSLAHAGCGDRGPATAPSNEPLALRSAGSVGIARLDLSQAGVTVAQILAEPAGFLNQEVELAGELVDAFPSGELLFDDGTGRIPMDFTAVGAAPGLGTAIVVTGTVTAGVVGGFAVAVAVTSWESAPSFSCDDVPDVRARFTEPGFVLGNVVGLFLAYRGLPPGEKTLEITWDEGDAAGTVERASVGEGVAEGDGSFSLEGVVSHEYSGVSREESKTVRAVLSIVGRDGGCARVRDVTVTPGSGPGSAGGGTLRVSIDEGSPVGSGTVFGVRAKLENPTFEDVSVDLVFQTPELARIADASGPGCQALSNDYVDCTITVPAGEKLTRVVKYRAPTVSANVSIGGAVGLVSGDFVPVVKYKLTVTP